MPTLSIPFSSVHSFKSISHSYHFKPNYPLTYCRSRRSFSSCAVRRRDDVDPFTKKSGYLFELSFSEIESLADYDFSRITAIYRRKPFLLARRLFQIGNTFGKWFALRYVDRVMERSDERFKVRAGELRKILVELGPAYIKIAQAVSSRADLIPPSYLDELTLLQDQIAPFPTEDAITLIEEELGLPVDVLFSEISPEPVAAASLGQVYKARLRQKGQVVAVKVQRPGVQAVISLDVLIMRFLAGVLMRVRKLNTDLQAVVDEWASSLFREMDYRKEAENGLKFRQLYGTIPDVLVPEMYVEHTSRRVLVMQWVEGQKLSEVKDLYLVEVGVYCSFNQLLEYGFYHADPHPGNLLRTYDGKLAYLDFGMIGEFRPELRDGFIEACLHLVNRDFDALAKDFVTLGLLPPTADNEAVTNALIGVFQNAVGKGVRNISFGDLIENLGTTMYQFKFRIPSYFSLVIRSLAVLEGIAVSSNPNYKVLGSTYPWIARKVLTDSSPKLKSSLQSLLYEEGVFRVDRLESLLTESLRARMENALVRKRENTISRIATNEILSYMLTDKGSFVRDILLQEFVKGLDALGLAILDSINSVAAAIIPFGAAFSLSTMTDVDKMNLRNLHRFLLLLSRLRTNDSSTKEDGGVNLQVNPKTDMEEVLLLVRHFVSVQEVLDILSLFPKLPPESQQQLLYLPADLSGRLISRVAAKTIRRIIL